MTENLDFAKIDRRKFASGGMDACTAVADNIFDRYAGNDCYPDTFGRHVRMLEVSGNVVTFRLYRRKYRITVEPCGASGGKNGQK